MLEKFAMNHTVKLLLIIVIIRSTAYAGYMSEEAEEKSKSVYSEVTSILKSSDQSKHHRKHTFTPCTQGECPCQNPPNCLAFNSVPAFPTPYTGSSYGGNYASNLGQENLQPKPLHLNGNSNASPFVMAYPIGVHEPNGYIPPGPSRIPKPPLIPLQSSQVTHISNGHILPKPDESYSYWSNYPAYNVKQGQVISNKIPSTATILHPPSQGSELGQLNTHPSHRIYHADRGYSIYDHSLKTNSEYTETGTYTGPLQHGNNGYGYGIGYGGSYNGLFNRPGY